MHYQTISEVAEAIRLGRTTSVALLQGTLERIAQYDGALQSFATVMTESATAAAEAADEAVREGRWLGPLHGVPVAIKDLYCTVDAPTTFGSAHLQDHYVPRDAEVVRLLRQAGAVIIGKLRMSEAALTDHGVGMPVPINPWNEATWVGTSSSGCASATAAGLCYASLGSDTGGSIRGPSTATGLTGLKPTRGAVSLAGAFPLSRTLDNSGPMARSARDCRLVFEVIKDRHALAYAERQNPIVDDKGVRRTRLGVDNGLLATVEKETRDMVEKTASIFESLGYEIVDVKTPDGFELASHWVEYVGKEAVTDWVELYPTALAGQYGAEVSYVLEQGEQLARVGYEQITALARHIQAQWDKTLDDVAAVLLPTVSTPSPTNEQVDEMRKDYAVWNREIMRLTSPTNFIGHPSLTFPTGFTNWGTPLGAQLIGRHHDEESLLRLCEKYQEYTDHHEQHPPLYP